MSGPNLKSNFNSPELKKTLLSTKSIVTLVTILVIVFLGVFIFQSCVPKKGSLLYGLCGSFLEQQVTFPQTIRHTSVEQYPKALRIYYTHIDAFGQYQFEMTECTFKQDPQAGVQLDRVFFNYVKDITSKERVRGKGRLYEVKRDVINLFNRSQSARSIMSQDPDLTLPQTGTYRF